VILEAAIVYPILLFLVLMIVLGGTAVFRYQQVALLAREAARWASVRGGDYHRDTNLPFPKEQDIFDQAVAPLATGMNLANLTSQVEWIDQSTGTAYPWDSASRDVCSIAATGEYVTNTVRVTASYQWSTGFSLLGDMRFQSISEIPMSY
jgi:Flp pilus assembly protein TadG